MSQPFLITGLPRSRTAWWSVVATTPVSTCAHEPLKDCASFGDLRRYFNRADIAYAGASDSGLAYQLGRILNEIEPRTLIVEREVEHVERSFARYFAGVPYQPTKLRHTLHELAAHLAKWRAHPLVRCVRFDALNDVRVVEDCLAWLMPEGTPALHRALMHMNIQADLSYALDAMRKPHNRWFLEE